ncbi:hypothetical protein ACWD2L_05940 [Streptomyces sp. NPDC002754]
MSDNDVPNIVSGTVASHRADSNSPKRTPSWLKFGYAVLATLLAIVVASLTLGPCNSDDGDTLKPCRNEDSRHCYWDADTMGNGEGHDVVTK